MDRRSFERKSEPDCLERSTIAVQKHETRAIVHFGQGGRAHSDGGLRSETWWLSIICYHRLNIAHRKVRSCINRYQTRRQL